MVFLSVFKFIQLKYYFPFSSNLSICTKLCDGKKASRKHPVQVGFDNERTACPDFFGSYKNGVENLCFVRWLSYSFLFPIKLRKSQI